MKVIFFLGLAGIILVIAMYAMQELFRPWPEENKKRKANKAKAAKLKRQATRDAILAHAEVVDKTESERRARGEPEPDGDGIEAGTETGPDTAPAAGSPADGITGQPETTGEPDGGVDTPEPKKKSGLFGKGKKEKAPKQPKPGKKDRKSKKLHGPEPEQEPQESDETPVRDTRGIAGMAEPEHHRPSSGYDDDDVFDEGQEDRDAVPDVARIDVPWPGRRLGEPDTMPDEDGDEIPEDDGGDLLPDPEADPAGPAGDKPMAYADPFAEQDDEIPDEEPELLPDPEIGLTEPAGDGHAARDDDEIPMANDEDLLPDPDESPAEPASDEPIAYADPFAGRDDGIPGEEPDAMPEDGDGHDGYDYIPEPEPAPGPVMPAEPEPVAEPETEPMAAGYEPEPAGPAASQPDGWIDWDALLAGEEPVRAAPTGEPAAGPAQDAPGKDAAPDVKSGEWTDWDDELRKIGAMFPGED